LLFLVIFSPWMCLPMSWNFPLAFRRKGHARLPTGGKPGRGVGM
jgi:hypothetical protein